MKKFRFRLQVVLDMREKELEERQMEMARIVTALNTQQEKLQNIFQRQKENSLMQETLAAAENLDIFQLEEHRTFGIKLIGDEIIKMLKEKGIEWSAYSNDAVWGSCCVRNNRPVIMSDGRRIHYMCDKNKRAKAWIIDHHIPAFVGDGRLYINALVYTESED